MDSVKHKLYLPDIMDLGRSENCSLVSITHKPPMNGENVIRTANKIHGRISLLILQAATLISLLVFHNTNPEKGFLSFWSNCRLPVMDQGTKQSS